MSVLQQWWQICFKILVSAIVPAKYVTQTAPAATMATCLRYATWRHRQMALNMLCFNFKTLKLFITVRRVIFLHVSVILSMWGASGRQTPPWQADTPWQAETRHPQQADTSWQAEPPRDGHCSRRYASHGNALLFFGRSLKKLAHLWRKDRSAKKFMC